MSCYLATIQPNSKFHSPPPKFSGSAFEYEIEIFPPPLSNMLGAPLMQEHFFLKETPLFSCGSIIYGGHIEHKRK